jgi:hypothetical protein
MKVLVCDDEELRCATVTQWVIDTYPEAIVTGLCGDGLKKALNALGARASKWLDAAPTVAATEPATIFDDTDVAIFDNNLAHLDPSGVRYTAEAVIGNVRAFSGARYIVSINKNPDVDFDLASLVGDPESRADLAIHPDHLKNRALWTGLQADASGGFLPWYWPRLGSVSERRAAQVDFVQARLGAPLFESLGLPPGSDTFSALTHNALGALVPSLSLDDVEGGINASDVTFHHVFTERGRSLPDKSERHRLETSGNADHKDIIIARVIAADIDLWFRRNVLAPQDALVDLPHMVSRLPFLLGTNVRNRDGWNAPVYETVAPFGLDQALAAKYLVPALFANAVWLPAPAFSWRTLKSNDELNDAFFAAVDSTWPRFVFQEDTSSFSEQPSQDEDQAKGPIEFTAVMESAWARRFVARLPGVRYSPLTCFAR